MFERRPVWGALIGLTVCISIWRISVQEPSMLAEYGYNGNFGGVVGNMPQGAATFYQPLYGAKHFLARKVNDISEEGRPAARSSKAESETNTDKTHTATQTNISKTSATQSFQVRLSPAFEPKQEQVLSLRGAAKLSAQKRAQTNTSNIYDSHNGKISGKRASAMGQQVSSSSSPSLQLNSLSSHHHRQHRYNHRQFISRFANVELSSSVNSTRISGSAATPSQTPAALFALENRRINYVTATSSTITTTPSTITTESVSSHLPSRDFQHLIDLYNFDYIMRQPACSPNISALILVHSAPANYRKRLLLRETWAQRSLLHDTPLLLMFLLGAVSNQTLQHKLRQENDMFADMVQGNFVDDYKNMTYKHVMAFKWFIYNCAHAQILLKVDDDVFVNTPQLLRYIKDSSETFDDRKLSGSTKVNVLRSSQQQQLFRHPRRLMFCQPMLRSRVKRSYRSKWRVSTHEYADRYYPPYCPGYSIVYSPDVLLRLYNAAQTNKYFWIDDVHVTGTLAQLSNITITSSLPFVMSSDTYERVIAGKTDLEDLEFLFAWPGITEQQIRTLWELSQLQYVSARSNEIAN